MDFNLVDYSIITVSTNINSIVKLEGILQTNYIKVNFSYFRCHSLP